MEEKLNNQESEALEPNERTVPSETERERPAEAEASPEPKVPPEVVAGGAVCCSKRAKWIIAAVIVVLVAAGAAYYYMAGEGTEEPLSQQEVQSIAAEIESQPDAAAEKLQQQGDSDAVTDIEADLGATELDALDKELQNIDSELNF